MRRFLSGSIILFLFWIAFTGAGDPAELITGAVVSLLISLVTYRIFDVDIFKADLPLRIIKLVFIYIPGLIWAMVKANISMAYIVLHPALPIDPGIIKSRSDLKRDISKLVMANSITLTPGTLTIDVEGDVFVVHCVNRTKVEKGGPVTGTFEKSVKGVFE